MMIQRYNLLRHNLIIVLIYLILLSIIFWYIFTTPPATGYEASLYFKYSPLFWASIIGIMSFTIMIVLFGDKLRIQYLILTIVISVLVRTILNIIPYIRGYFLDSKSDALLHLGAIKDIIKTGFIPTQDFYPIPHILGAIMRYICNCHMNLVILLFPAYSFLVFIMGYYLFISKIFITKKHSLKFFILALAIPIGTRFVNRDLSLSLLIIMLSIFVSARLSNAQRYILLTVFFANLVYFHPLTSIYALGAIVLLGLNYRVIYKIRNELNFLKYLVIITLILWVTWYLSFSQIQYNLKLLLTSEVNPYLSGNIHVVEMYNIPIGDLIKMLFYRYGEIALFGTAFLVASIKLLKNIKKGHRKYNIKMLQFVFITIAFSFWGIVTLVMRFVDYARIFKYIIMFSIPIATYALLSKRSKWSIKKNLSSIIFTLLVMYIMVFSVYQSPLVGLENPQTTRSEYTGWGWLFMIGNNNYAIVTGRSSDVKWFYSAIYGTDEAFSNPLIYTNHSLAPHFGYPNISEAGRLFTKKTYMVTNNFMITFYPSVLPDKPDSWKWTRRDYVRIKTDPSANLVYASRDCWIYLVNPS